MELKENMRIMNCGNNKNLVDFEKWLQCLGDGNLQTHGDTDYVTLPSQICTEIENGNEAKSEDEAISFVFGDIETECTKRDWPEYVAKRAILAPLNEIVNRINSKCLEKLPGDEVILAGINRTVNANDATSYNSERISTLESSGIPSSVLKLKVGAPIMLLRNLIGYLLIQPQLTYQIIGSLSNYLQDSIVRNFSDLK